MKKPNFMKPLALSNFILILFSGVIFFLKYKIVAIAITSKLLLLQSSRQCIVRFRANLASAEWKDATKLPK